MSNDNAQGNTNELGVIGKIEVKIKPKNYEQFEEHLANVNYFHTILDKLVMDLNEEFVPKLDSVLSSNKNSITKLDSKLQNLQSELNELRDEMPEVLGALQPFHTTVEENGLL